MRARDAARFLRAFGDGTRLRILFLLARSALPVRALAMALRGYERFVLDLAQKEQPDLIHQVLDYAVQVQTRYALALKQAGAHGTATGGLGVDIIGPRLHRQLEHPYERRFVEAAQSPDFPVALHICGDSTQILDAMVETGAQILELDYKTDMLQAKKALQGKSTFLGPVNPELIWSAVSPQVVEETA